MKKILIGLTLLASMSSFAAGENGSDIVLMSKNISQAWTQDGKDELGEIALNELSEECKGNDGKVIQSTKRHLLGEGNARRSHAVLVCIY